MFGKLAYEDLTSEAKAQLLLGVCEIIVKNNEARYVAYFNELQPLTPRLHGLELIPGIGKTFMKTTIELREKQPFTSFDDIQNRVGLREPAKSVAKRIAEELTGASRVNIFVSASHGGQITRVHRRGFHGKHPGRECPSGHRGA